MKVSPIKCPKCETPSKMNDGDVLFMCESCGTLHHMETGTPEAIGYEVVISGKENDSTEYYPIWRLNTEFSVVSTSDSFWSSKYDKKGSRLYIHMPAWDTSPADFRKWSVNLTTGNWKYQTGGEIGIHKRIPARMSREQAYDMADFVVVTIEAEKPGVLQYLDYNLKILESEILYIPQNP